VTVRQNMLAEAVPIIRRLLDGESVTTGGEYFRVDSAKLWDLPAQPVQIGIAVSGEQSIKRFAALADHLVAVEPDATALTAWDRVRSGQGLADSRKIGQVPISWGPDRDAAIARAHDLFRWFGAGWSPSRSCRDPRPQCRRSCQFGGTRSAGPGTP